MEYYSRKNGQEKEYLIHHLKRTGELCEEFTSSFNHKKIGRILGQMHDIGKRTEKFQEVLDGKRIKIDHAIVGGYLISQFKKNNNVLHIRNILGNIIASHHSELDFNNVDLTQPTSFDKCTNDKQKEISLKDRQELMEIVQFLKTENLLENIEDDDFYSIDNFKQNYNNIMLYVRFLYSCLIDADYCASAEFSNTNYLLESNGGILNPKFQLDKLNNYRNNLIKNSKSNSKMNELRNIVFEDCLNAGNIDENLFTLTAPTGTSKTLGFLVFGLLQCLNFNKERIFIVVPQLSIINQIVEICKTIFGDDIILEDDSNVEYTEETRIYADRWSSPIIITTSVKFFETLFESKGSKLRKLHNVSNSVVIFDETHTLPNDLLNCTIETMNELGVHYNTTVLFSSATPLNYSYRQNVIWKPTEIIKDVNFLYSEYSKVKQLELKWDIKKFKTYNNLIDEITEEQVMFMFNTKNFAKKMYKLILEKYDKDNCFYLTTSLCPKHKLEVINKVSERLKNNLPCILITTQCVEAGVDFDFKQVFRQLAPYSSIIQASGRCNRNCNFIGKFVIFDLQDDEIKSERQKYPGDEYRNMALNVKTMLLNNNNYLDINNLNNLDTYSKLLFNNCTSKKDKKELLEAIKNLDFPKVAKEYKLIDNSSYSIIVPYSKSIKEYEHFRNIILNNDCCITKRIMKEVQGFTVNCISKKDKSFVENNLIQLNVKINGNIYPINYFLLDSNNYQNYYDKEIGLDFSDDNNLII